MKKKKGIVVTLIAGITAIAGIIFINSKDIEKIEMKENRKKD